MVQMDVIGLDSATKSVTTKRGFDVSMDSSFYLVAECPEPNIHNDSGKDVIRSKQKPIVCYTQTSDLNYSVPVDVWMAFVCITSYMKSILLLLITILFWSLNFYLGKITMEFVSPNATAFWRYLFGILVLLGFTYGSFPSWSKIKQNLEGIILVGLALFGFIFFFFQGLKYTSAMNGALIVSLNPATTLFLVAIFQGHKIRIQEILGILVALIGVLYLLTQGALTTLFAIEMNLGDGYFLLANLCFALQNIWIKKYASKLGNLPFTTLTNLFCFLGFLILMFFEPQFPIAPYPPKFWLAVIGMGVPGTAMAYIFWNYGINQIGPAKGAIFINAVPLFTAIFAILFGAQLYPFHIWSTLLIIAGLLLVQIKR